MNEVGTDDFGFVDRSQVKLLIWMDGGEASLAGPATDNLAWVVQIIYSLAAQWQDQEPQQVASMPNIYGDDCLDCTRKELAIVVYNAHDVIVERGEIFPGSGLSSYYIDVAGIRKHETEWVIEQLHELATGIEQQEGFDHVI